MPQFMIDGIHVHKQKLEVWCWCAVTEGVMAYYRNPLNRSQCQIASDVLNNPDCCGNPIYCFTLEDLSTSLTFYQHLAGAPIAGLSDSGMREVLARGFAACVRVSYNTDGHVLAVSGLDTDRHLVRLHDPFTDDTSLWWFYNGNEISRTPNPSPEDIWTVTTTYLTKPA